MVDNSSISLSILVVEDSAQKLESIVEVINSSGIAVQQTLIGEQIQAQQALLIRKFDLLILDMQLPLRTGDVHADPGGGLNILSDLFVDDNYKMPSGIIALTEFDHLELRVREEFPDVAVLRFDRSSEKWREGLKRRIQSAVKSKVTAKKIVYCEGTDVHLYNLTDLPDFEFRGLTDSRAIYLAAKNEPDKFALRDRDFITNQERDNLQKAHRNYRILQYYSIESYLYHPDNIYEVKPGFDNKAYISDILAQIQAKLINIVQDYKLSRNGCLDLTDNGKAHMSKRPEDDIVKSLRSNSFEECYTYFDMAGKKDDNCKKSYNKLFLASLGLTREELAKTKWFKGRVLQLLVGNNLID